MSDVTAIRDIRDPDCAKCKLNQTADVVCQIGYGPPKADIMVVSKMANSKDWQFDLLLELQEAGIDTSRVLGTRDQVQDLRPEPIQRRHQGVQVLPR